ncbi:MAG TPA: ribose-phosphate pyrophosphokinase [Candidatus Eremiobacteraeota bacterium]|nr:MAG: Ribose-phosphate pyrophosphokinase [bacterium ADurb.Bin363]HPZ09189.1 ribose-phosphate pyrophosphokinase [Candidatus Eremiobacteraeota bacterium]
MNHEHDLVVIAGRAGKQFAQKVVKEFIKLKECPLPDLTLGEVDIIDFPNGELSVRLDINVRKKTVHVFQSIILGKNKNIFKDFFEIFIINDTLKRAGAQSIMNYWSFLPFQRQDRKTKGREPISAKLIFDLLSSSGGKYFNRMVTAEMHTDAAQGFADIPVDNVRALPLFLLYYKNHAILKNLDLSELVVVSPDTGGAARARFFAEKLGTGCAIIEKRRFYDETGKTESLQLIGNVKNKYAIMIDDIIDTGSSVLNGADLLWAEGAKKVFACCTHGLFSTDKKGVPAEKKFYDANIEVLTTDTIPRGQTYYDTSYQWLRTVSMASYFADALYCNHTGQSFSECLQNHLNEAIANEVDIQDYLIPITPKELWEINDN